MDKKLLSVTLSAAIVALAASCSSEDIANNSGDKVPVQFKVSANSALATRAIGDGSTVDQLVYRVFDKNGNIISGLEKKTESGLSDLKSGHTVTLMLAKGQTYKIVFWAQNEDAPYTLDDNMNVSIDYSGENNAENRDAFYKTIDDYTVSNDKQGRRVSLTRPFAQVNVGSSEEDWTNAKNSGVKIAKSKVTIKGLATGLNLLDGSVSGNADATFDFGDINSDATFTTDGETYHYLSTTYVLPTAETANASSLAAAEYTFQPEDADKGQIELSEGLENMPIQRNYRTNIIGQILTGEVRFTVKVDPNFTDDFNDIEAPLTMNGKVYRSLADAVNEINSGNEKEYNLTLNPEVPDGWNDVSAYPATNPSTGGQQQVVSIGKPGTTVNIDLGKSKITLHGESSIDNGSVVLRSEGTLNLKNGNIDYKMAGEPFLSGIGQQDYVRIEGDVNLNNVTADYNVKFTGNVVARNCTFQGGNFHSKKNGNTTMLKPVTLEGENRPVATFINCTFGSEEGAQYNAIEVNDQIAISNTNSVDAIYGGINITGCTFLNFQYQPILFNTGRLNGSYSDADKYVVKVENSTFKNTGKLNGTNMIYTWQTGNGQDNMQTFQFSGNTFFNASGEQLSNIDGSGNEKAVAGN